MIERAILSILELKKIVKEMDLKTKVFIIPFIFLVLAAVFDGISMALLAPVGKGVINMDFSFVRQMPILGDMILLLETGLKGKLTGVRCHGVIDILEIHFFLLF